MKTVDRAKKCCLKTEMIDANNPVRRSTHILSYFDDVPGYAQSFVSETYDECWHRYFARSVWPPNEAGACR